MKKILLSLLLVAALSTAFAQQFVRFGLSNRLLNGTISVHGYGVPILFPVLPLTSWKCGRPKPLIQSTIDRELGLCTIHWVELYAGVLAPCSLAARPARI